MLPIHYDTFYSPPSSPASIAGTSWADSSPPSSPTLEPLSLDSEPESGVTPHRAVDPLRASYNFKLPKRTAAVLTPPVSPQKRARYASTNSKTGDNAEDGTASCPDPPENAVDEKAAIWEAAGVKAFEERSYKFEFQDKGLTSISSQFLKDLGNMVFLPPAGDLFLEKTTSRPATVSTAALGRRTFTRVQTAPTIPSFSRRGPNVPERSISSVTLKTCTSTSGVEIYLAGNRISKLPPELWNLQTLTVLSLRNNNISYIPPEIANLRNLLEFNISNNRIKFIPSEILNMKVQSLVLHPNPFILEPHSALVTRPISDIELPSFLGEPSSVVPSLIELSLRVLLSRPSLSPTGNDIASLKTPNTHLEQLYDLPLATGPGWRPISSPLRRILATCVPGSIIASDCRFNSDTQEEESTQVTGVGKCPNPRHEKRTIFVKHAEQRFTWENNIAGQNAGGAVPVRWRGCTRGCLEFLGKQGKADDGEMEGIVQTMQFGGSLDDVDEF